MGALHRKGAILILSVLLCINPFHLEGQSGEQSFPDLYDDLTMDSLLRSGYHLLYNVNDYRAKDLFDESVSSAFANADSLLAFRSLAAKSSFYMEKGVPDSAEYFVTRAKKFLPATRSTRFRAYTFDLLANINAGKGFKQEGYKKLDTAMFYAVELNDAELMAKISISRGYFALGDGLYRQATRSFQMADSILSSFPRRFFVHRAKSWMGQGMIFADAGDYDRAYTKFVAAREEVSESKHPERTSLELSIERLIGQYLLDVGKLNSADSLFKIAIKKASDLGKTSTNVGLMNRYSEIKLRLGELDEAEEVLEKLGQFNEVKDIPFHKGRYHFQLGKLFLRKGDAAQSIDHFRQSMSVINEKNLSYSYYLKYLAEAFRELEELDSAYYYMELYGLVKDSLNQQAVQSHIQEIESRMYAAEKESEISKIELTRSEENLRNQRILGLITIGILFLSIVILVLYYRFREKAQAHHKLSELNQLRSKLFADISHEFRTPLSLIKGPISNIRAKVGKEHHLADEFDIVDRNTSALNRMIDEIQNLALLDEKKLRLTVRRNPLEDQLKLIGSSFHSHGLSKKVSFQSEIQIPPNEYFYNAHHLETILYNLLSNAFKFTNEGKVTLSGNIVENELLVTVEDTGIGMTLTEVKNIFNRYFQIAEHSDHQGSGIGLSLSRELATLHFGDLSVLSTKGKGTKFVLTLPVTYDFYRSKGTPVEFDEPASLLEVSSTYTNIDANVIQTVEPNDQPIILVIEDHPDMIKHIQSLFEPSFKTITAYDGSSGIDLAKNEIPDIILSDLMLPMKNGKQVLESIKQDPNTSHIPFIMLTANHSEQEKLQGLNMGAIDYITKPFSPEELVHKIRNLLDLRNAIQSKFSDVASLPSELIKSSGDQMFWDRLKDVMNKNITDPEFTIEKFAKAMYMSRMQLHRKLKATTNLSASIFLRQERVKRSLVLLTQTDLSVTQISFEVGYSDPSFFSKCFKEVLQVSPSDYRQSNSIPRLND